MVVRQSTDRSHRTSCGGAPTKTTPPDRPAYPRVSPGGMADGRDVAASPNAQTPLQERAVRDAIVRDTNSRLVSSRVREIEFLAEKLKELSAAMLKIDEIRVQIENRVHDDLVAARALQSSVLPARNEHPDRRFSQDFHALVRHFASQVGPFPNP